jgi:transposase
LVGDKAGGYAARHRWLVDDCPAAIVFRNRLGNRIKVLLWDGTGVWLCQRRLHEGHFIWPKSTDTCFSVTFEQWQWLIAGVNWQRLSAILSADLQV